MALNTREMLLVLRVSDRTGGALRRVSRDLGGMQNKQQLAAQTSYQKSLAQTTAIRAKDARAASTQATMALRNLRNQKAAAESAIISLKQQGAQDAVVTRRLNEQVAAYNRLTAAIGRQTDVAKGLRTTRLQTAAAADFAASKYSLLQQRDSELKWAGLERGARLAEHLGRALAIGGTVGVLALGASAKQAAGAQTQVALAATQARTPGAPASQTLEKQRQLMAVVLQQMKQFPAASQDMANSLYEIFSGTNIQNIPKAAGYLKTFNQMAVAGGTDLKTMTDAGLTLYNNFMQGASPEFKTMAGAANEFFAAVRYGRMNAAQFAGSLSQVIPIAQRAGLTFHDIGAAMAYITRQTGGARARYDATGLARLIEAFNNPNVQTGLKNYGVQVIDPVTKKMHSLYQIMQQIAKRVPNLQGAESLNFFKQISSLGSGGRSQGTSGFINARRIFSYLYEGIKTGQYQKVLQDITKDQNEFKNSYAAMAQTPGVKWEVFINQLKALSIVIGTAVIPVFAELGGYIERAVNWFQSLSPQTQKMIAQFALFVSVGALVGGAVLMIVGGLASLFLTIRIGLRSFGLLGAETGAVNVRMLMFMGVLGGLIVILWKFPGLFQQVTNAVGGTKNMIMLLSILVGVLTFQKMIGGLVGVAAEATIATSEVRNLRGALLGLPTAIAITIAITRVITELHGLGGRNAPKITKPVNAANLGGYYVPGTGGKPVFHFGGMPSDIQKASISGFATPDRDPTGKLGGLEARKRYEAAQAALDKLNKQAAVLAIQTGIPTANIQKLELNVLKAKEALIGLSPTDVKKNLAGQLRLANATSALQTATTKAQSDAYLKAVNTRVAAETRAQKKGLADQTRAAKAAAKLQNTTYADALTNLSSMYQSFFQQQQQNYGSLFQGPVLTGARMQTITQWGGHASPADLLKDIRSQNFQYGRFNRLVGRLGRRGAPTELVNQLRAAGPAAMQDIYNLTKMTPTQWKQYVAAFKSGQAAIKQQTMAQLNSQINLYKQHGVKVAQAIVAGITSQDQKVSHAIDNMLRKAIGLKPTADYTAKPKATTVNHIYHISGTPGDYHKTRAAVRHSLFRVRAHTVGAG